MKPFFTIITPTYNSCPYVSHALETVLQQSFTDFEHIIVDGYSKDKTSYHIKEHVKLLGKRARIIKAVPTGVYNAINIGLKNSHGRYVVFLNSDDFFSDKDALARIYFHLKQLNFPRWLVGVRKAVNENGKEKYYSWRAPFLKYLGVYLGFNMFCHQNTVVDINLFEQFGYFREDLVLSSDFAYWSKLLLHGQKPVFVKDNFITFRYSRKSLSTRLAYTIGVIEAQKVSWGHKAAKLKGLFS